MGLSGRYELLFSLLLYLFSVVFYNSGDIFDTPLVHSPESYPKLPKVSKMLLTSVRAILRESGEDMEPGVQ